MIKHLDTDAFASTPILFDSETKRLGDDFPALGITAMSPHEIDPVAFWMSLVWENPLGLRTVRTGVIQLPGGSHCEVDMSTGCIRTTRREFFHEPATSLSESDLLTALDSRLQAIARAVWEQVPAGGDILLPLSGGLDSRLLACHLATTGDPGRIRAVTFGYGPGSYEYRLARRICRDLKIERHEFHPLSRRIYAEVSEDFYRRYLGGLSVMHAHLYTYLRSHPPHNALLVSGFGADAISGWASMDPARMPSTLEGAKAFKGLAGVRDRYAMPGPIFDQIRSDLEMLWREWAPNHGDVNFDEYLYLSQRQTKAYMLLLNMYRDFCPVAMPFGDDELRRLLLSAPFRLRWRKRVSQLLICRRRPSLGRILDLSSSPNLRSARSRAFFWARRGLIHAAVGLAQLTDDRVRWMVPFMTEDVMGAMRVEHRPAILTILERLRLCGLLTPEQAGRLSAKPARGPEIMRHARLLSLAPCVLRTHA